MSAFPLKLLTPNAGAGSPAYTCLVDYFFNTAAPLDPEDACGSTASLSGSTGLSDLCESRTLTVGLYEPGTTALVQEQTASIDANEGFSLDGITAGAYDVLVKVDYYLAKKITDVVFTAGAESPLDLSGLIGGDGNNDNVVSIIDFSILSNTFEKQEGDAGYDGRADFNCDGAISIVDFSILSAGFESVGDEAGY